MKSFYKKRLNKDFRDVITMNLGYPKIDYSEKTIMTMRLPALII